MIMNITFCIQISGLTSNMYNDALLKAQYTVALSRTGDVSTLYCKIEHFFFLKLI